MKRVFKYLITLLILTASIQSIGQIVHQVSPITEQMKQHALLPNIKQFIGTVANNAAAIYSTGNNVDGSGFYMLGSIPWSVIYYVNRSRKVFANWGDVRKKYNTLNNEHSFLGWPGDDERLLPDGTGYFQQFNHGYIYWHPMYGAHIVEGIFFNYWAKNNWEKGVFGYPTEDEYNYPTTPKDKSKESFQKFYNGIIYVSENLITHQITESSKIYNPNYNPSRAH
jgi:hypothetical protein